MGEERCNHAVAKGCVLHRESDSEGFGVTASFIGQVKRKEKE